MRVSRLVAAVAVTPLLVVSACTSDAAPEPAPLPSASTESPAPSASPSPSSPALPAEAEGTSPAAAKAFVRHYIEAVNYASSTGEVNELRSLSSSKCSSCTALIERIETVYTAGGSFRGDGWKVRSIRYQPFQPARQPVLSVSIRLSPQTLVEEAGEPDKKFPGGRDQLTLRLTTDQGDWRVSELERLA